MVLADTRSAADERHDADARPLDGLALGIAQAVALVPGVSRYGATLVAARSRGFSRASAQVLSWHAALPVMLGASALQGARLAQRGLPEGSGAALFAGAGSAFVSTLLSARVLRRRAPALLPYSLYRLLIAALVLAGRRRRPTSDKRFI